MEYPGHWPLTLLSLRTPHYDSIVLQHSWHNMEPSHIHMMSLGETFAELQTRTKKVLLSTPTIS